MAVPTHDGTMKARTILALLVGVVGLTALIVAAAVVAGRDAERYPAGSPEAAVQAYVRAVVDDRPDDAVAWFSVDLADRCGFGTVSGFGDVTVTRVVLDRTRLVTGGDGTERAEVRVRVTERWGGPFATDESTFTEIIVLTNDSDGWHIAEPPWPYSDCGPWPTVEAER